MGSLEFLDTVATGIGLADWGEMQETEPALFSAIQNALRTVPPPGLGRTERVAVLDKLNEAVRTVHAAQRLVAAGEGE